MFVWEAFLLIIISNGVTWSFSCSLCFSFYKDTVQFSFKKCFKESGRSLYWQCKRVHKIKPPIHLQEKGGKWKLCGGRFKKASRSHRGTHTIKKFSSSFIIIRRFYLDTAAVGRSSPARAHVEPKQSLQRSRVKKKTQHEK